MEGDLLDAVVLGPRRAYGTTIRTRAWGAVTLTDRGMSDDKLICSDRPVTADERERVLRFFRFYARCKAVRNALRGKRGRNACDGWCDAQQAMARAIPRTDDWAGARVPY
jgi:inorganic pyrophosphatase